MYMGRECVSSSKRSCHRCRRHRLANRCRSWSHSRPWACWGSRYLSGILSQLGYAPDNCCCRHLRCILPWTPAGVAALQVDAVCPGKKAGETCRTAVHDFEVRCLCCRTPTSLGCWPHAGAGRAGREAWLGARSAQLNKAQLWTADRPFSVSALLGLGGCSLRPRLAASTVLLCSRLCRVTRHILRSRGTTSS
jgi:hypothetical protein